MKIALLIACLGIISCGQSTNSNTNDYLLSGNGIDPTNTKLLSAFNVINNNCISCHTGYHDSWSSLNTDELWIKNGSVIEGAPLSSDLITRLKNRGGDMPLLNTMITEDEYDYLVDWIESL